jgi:hypothetical protein
MVVRHQCEKKKVQLAEINLNSHRIIRFSSLRQSDQQSELIIRKCGALSMSCLPRR